MAITTFIPTIWEARLLAHLDKALIYGNLCNRDYEGDISQAGDTVIINQIGDIAIKDYKKTEDITLDDVDGTPTQLKIDQQKYFAFKVDDVDAAINDFETAQTTGAAASTSGWVKIRAKLINTGIDLVWGVTKKVVTKILEKAADDETVTAAL